MTALIVPDEQAWTVWGEDPARTGARPAYRPGAAAAVLVPERVPEPLAGPLRDWLADAPEGVRLERRPLPLPGGVSVETLLRPPGPHGGAHDAEHDHGHDEHAEHGGHDHHDMMAVVGEPSADGLVMEPIELTFGPLGTPLPGGIVAEVTLDGDVVERCAVRALLAAEPGSAASPPDPLAPAAWGAAIAAADGAGAGWADVAAVELERAVSHLAWLRALGRLLGYEALVGAAGRALASVHDARAAGGGLDAAGRAAAAALAVLEGRALAARTRGRARVTAEEARERGVRGVVARAAGSPDDARATDPRYAELGFSPLTAAEGDAHARTLLRGREAVHALELAAAATRRTGTDSPEPGAAVEGPRGPLRAERRGGDLQLSAPGCAAALDLAGEAMVGEEWSAALIALASFDLSPWRVL